jgi:hypothetical protein
MALSETQRPRPVESPDAPTLELIGVDLTRDPAWRGERWAANALGRVGGALAPTSGDHPVSPMGFQFRVAGASDASIGALRVTMRRPGGPAEISLAETRRRTTSAFVRRVSIPAANRKQGELTLVIGTDGADVFASEMTWESLTEPVLLLAAQFSRYGALERQFLASLDQSRRDHHHAVSAGVRTLWEHKRLVRAACDSRDLVSDWVYVTGPMADPSRSCTSEESLEVYSSLAEALDIEAWAKSIDDVAVDVEQTYETISDKLFHYRLFMWGMAVEAVIVGLIAGLLVH